MALILSGDTGVPASGMPTGSVIQTVSVTTNTSTTANTNAAVLTGLTLNITPISTTSKIMLVMSGGDLDNQVAGRQPLMAFYKNGSLLIAFADNYTASTTRLITPTAGSYLDSPATTSSTTYAVYVWSGTNNTVIFNSQGGYATLTALEIKG